jgi:peptide/nickel transport system permease protein
MRSLTPAFATRLRVPGRSRSKGQGPPSFAARFARNRAALGGLILVGIIIVMAAFAPVLAPADPFALSSDRLQPPLQGSLLGTDHLGRDMLSRLLHGARTSVMVGVLAAVTATIIGVAVGALAGYFGGRIDTVLMRFTEAAQIVPKFFLAVLIVALFGGGLDRIIAVIALLSWPPTARTTRAQFLTFREHEFVEAAQALGFGSRHVILHEILPNAAAPIIVLLSLDVAQAVLLEAGLAFVGLGDSSTVSWGTMLNDAQAYLRAAWWVSVIPGIAIFMLVMGANLLGDGLNDALNPRLKER